MAMIPYALLAAIVVAWHLGWTAAMDVLVMLAAIMVVWYPIFWIIQNARPTPYNARSVRSPNDRRRGTTTGSAPLEIAVTTWGARWQNFSRYWQVFPQPCLVWFSLA